MPSARKLTQQAKQQAKVLMEPVAIGQCNHCGLEFMSKYEAKRHACMASLRAEFKKRYAAE